MTCELAVSDDSTELSEEMSEMFASTRWPPFLPCGAFWVEELPPLPHASRNSTPPAVKAPKATTPPIRRRKSRRDHSFRNRSKLSKPSGALLPIGTSSPSPRFSQRVRPGGRTGNLGIMVPVPAARQNPAGPHHHGHRHTQTNPSPP